MHPRNFLWRVAFGIALCVGCNEDNIQVSPQAPGFPFEIKTWEYSTNHFFVDTSYRSSYEEYYRSIVPIVNLAGRILSEEVWIQVLGSDTSQITVSRTAVACIYLDPRGQGYDSALRTQPLVPGQVESGRFYRLDPAQYQMDGQAFLGVVSLKTVIPEDAIVAISYSRADGTQYGEYSSQLPADSTLVLKMIKPAHLFSEGSAYTVAWNQLLKNIYPIGGRQIKDLSVSIRFVSPSFGETDRISGHPLLNVLGVDRYNTDGTMAPSGDGEFDFRPGFTIDPGEGEIIFPYLRPFDEGILEYFRSQGLSPPDSTYLTPGIYDTVRAVASSNARYYTIKGRAQVH